MKKNRSRHKIEYVITAEDQRNTLKLRDNISDKKKKKMPQNRPSRAQNNVEPSNRPVFSKKKNNKKKKKKTQMTRISFIHSEKDETSPRCTSSRYPGGLMSGKMKVETLLKYP